VSHIWAIVLAGGDGTRLKSLTDDGAGNFIPKQFCSLDGVQSLAEAAIARAVGIVDPACITAIVSAPHAPHWNAALRGIAPENVIVQPGNRGTAAGLLLPALEIHTRDRDARLLILPSDQFVAKESLLQAAMRRALHAVERDDRGFALLGLEAEEPDAELGYIVARRPGSPSGLMGVRRFVEKPAPEEARRLWAAGALWNSFIIACRADSLLELYRAQCPALVRALERRRPADLHSIFQRLEPVDFSRQVVGTQVERLAVMQAPRCGWSDLGTPERLASTFVRHPSLGCDGARRGTPQVVNLAERLSRRCPGALARAHAALHREWTVAAFADGRALVRSRG
jgi:mannose-1-phosphate guanylyltransferase